MPLTYNQVLDILLAIDRMGPGRLELEHGGVRILVVKEAPATPGGNGGCPPGNGNAGGAPAAPEPTPDDTTE